MAQLNSLIVTGPSRFLNKLMATEIQATGLNVADKLSVTSSVFTYNSRKVMTGSSVGNSTTPVYIDANGYPVAISSYSGTSASAVKANYLNLYEARGTTTTLNKPANYVAAGAMFHLIASSSTTNTAENGKTPDDANILQMNWDNNGGYDSQMGISTSSNRMFYRSMASQKTAWREVASIAASTQTGSATKGVYVSNSGKVTAMTYSLNATINAGAANKLAYYSGANAISQYTSTIGTATKGIYMNAGWPTAMTYELKATLNNATQWGVAYYSTATNVMSTAAGTAGYLLQGNGAAAPSWIQATNANTANTIVKRDGSGNFSAGTITASLNGNAATASKWLNARNITLAEDLQGVITIDGSKNVTLNARNYSCSVGSGNKSNYPWHRIATTGTITGSWTDKEMIIAIRHCYNNGGYGVAKIALKTNNVSNGNVANASIRWLYRYNISANDLQIGLRNTSGNSLADLYYKVGSYVKCIIYQLQGSRSWTLINSTEVNNTTATDKKTSTECYASISDAATELGITYTNTIVASDGATVQTANYADKANGDTTTIRASYIRKIKQVTSNGTTFTFRGELGDGSNANNLITIPTASATIAGLITNAAQTIAGDKTFTGRVYIKNTSDAALGTADSGALVIGDKAGEHIIIDSNEIMGKANGTTVRKLLFQWDGGDAGFGGKILPKADKTLSVGSSSERWNEMFSYIFNASTKFTTDSGTFYADNSGNGYFSNTLGIAGTNTGYKLYVNGTSWVKGNLWTRNLYPEADSTYDIGSTTYHWRYGYFDGLYISSNTSYSAWNSGANGVFINTDNFGIQRTSAGGGFYVYSNGIQAARMYLDTIGTAGDGTNAGALGSARLVLGNSTARSSTSGTGANNARGILQIYSQSDRLGVEMWGDGGGGNIRIYSPSQTYYTNASNATAAHFWQIDSSNGNLRFYNYYGGSSTAASTLRGIYFERTGTIFPKDNNIQNLGTSSKYWANAYITTINGTTFTGNAASATKLATARTLTIGNTGKSFNGTADVSWSRDEIGCSYDHYTTWDFTKAYSSNYVTFDMQKPSGGPGGWINAFVSTHGNYLSSFIANVHRSGDWYVGWSEHSSTANVNPTWYKLLHTGNYTSTLDSRYILKSGDTMTGTINSMDIIPKADNTYTLGTSTNRWKEIFGYTLTAYTKLQAGSSYLNSSNDLYIARSVGIKVAPDTNYALKVTDNSYFNGHLILADNKFIRRNGRSVSWIQGRDGAILRQTTYTGYNPIISAKTTDGDWSFGPSGSNIMYLTYCTDANYNAGTNTTTAQFLFKPDGTMYIGSNKVLDSSMFSLSGTTLTITI